uniref:Uncharacterized protein n=1 Tax=Arundo donax TaxID=35708 RepID=A0A0A9B590_ARUDO
MDPCIARPTPTNQYLPPVWVSSTHSVHLSRKKQKQ